MSRTRVNVIQDTDEPVEKDVLATAIVKLSNSVGSLLESGLNTEAVVVLLQDATKLPKKKIHLVINALGQLRSDYTHD